MTEREREILGLIRANPLIAQQDIASRLGITRSSVGVHIANLIKKGYIKGKGYVLDERDYVTVIGGANVDIQGFTNSKLILKDSNPGKVRVSLGGVGRNIAENLVKMGIGTKLISAIGGDIYGAKILEESKITGIDMENSLVLKEASSSTYLSILNEKGDMEIAISDMDIFDKISIDFIRQNTHVINNSRLAVVDTNIPRETLEYLLITFEQVDFFLDSVSTTKAKKVNNIIGRFHTIKPNKIEAEVLTGIKINNEEDLKRSLYYFLNKGIKQVFISLGEEGIFYGNEKEFGFLKSPSIKVVNATGAGDAFVAALVYSYISGFTIDHTARVAMGASILALSHENTINPRMSIENINIKLKELNII